MADSVYYKRLLVIRDKQLEALLNLERTGASKKKIRKAAQQLLALNETIKEYERQEGIDDNGYKA